MNSTYRNAVIFVPLAINQTLFYKGVADQLIANGTPVIFITCHERSHIELESEGYASYNFFDFKKKTPSFSQNLLQEKCSKLGMGHPNLIITHEKECYQINSDLALYKKLFRSLCASEEILNQISKEYDKVTVFQELGGFLSVQSIFHTAQELNITHYFLEPSFFRGRICYVRDTIKAPKIKFDDSVTPSKELLEYIEQTIKGNKIVTPSKDLHHYKGTFSKLFNVYNLKRLVQKIYDKYILNLDEEFKFINVHFKKHLNALFTNYLLTSKYCKIPADNFNYYPLHVPADVALTIRSTYYLDQLYVIEEISKSLPLGEFLYIKEHPAMIGAIPASRLKSLLRKRQNVKILNPNINNFDILKKCKTVFTINSKAGAEATLFSKNVYVMGDAFYLGNPNISFLNSVKELYEINLENNEFSKEANMSFLQCTWNQSQPGDLYRIDNNNFALFSSSISQLI